MSKYKIIIKKIDPKRHYGQKYEIIVYWDEPREYGYTSSSRTLWGAKKEVQKIIKKHELPKEETIIIKEYEL